MKITRYTAGDLDALCDFDSSVCGFSREEAVEVSSPNSFPLVAHPLVCPMFLQFVATNSSVIVAKGDGVVDGMLACSGSKVSCSFRIRFSQPNDALQIFALYAETMEIAHALIKHCILENGLKQVRRCRESVEKNSFSIRLAQVSFFTREDVWECKPISARPAHRRHTRAVPSNIKWSKVWPFLDASQLGAVNVCLSQVYALNMGFHIV